MFGLVLSAACRPDVARNAVVQSHAQHALRQVISNPTRQLLDPERALPISPEFESHAIVHADPFVVGVVLFVFGIGPRVVGAARFERFIGRRHGGTSPGTRGCHSDNGLYARPRLYARTPRLTTQGPEFRFLILNVVPEPGLEPGSLAAGDSKSDLIQSETTLPHY